LTVKKITPARPRRFNHFIVADSLPIQVLLYDGSRFDDPTKSGFECQALLLHW
jgi:hypothetical protein